MTHYEEYNKIIDFRKANPLPKDQYGENHHIVPKSICPLLTNAKSNIVRLSAQEHFLAHYHIWKAFRDEFSEKTWAKKMCYAFSQMKRLILKCDDVEAMSKLYDDVRVALSQCRKGKPTWNKGKKWDQTTLQKNRESHLGKPSGNKGKHMSKEAKEKISITMKVIRKGKHHTDTTKQKIAKSQIGLKVWNNGVVCVRAAKCPEGFVAGMLKRLK